MTTIAYRDGMLAADTAMCQGGVMMGHLVKIHRRGDGHMVGAAGDASYNARFSKWFLEGEKGPPPEAKEGPDWLDRGVIFRRDGSLHVFEPRGDFRCSDEFYALGSGKEAALGAMFAGATAENAVRAAIRFDPHTGGDVTVLRCGVY